MDNSDQIYKPLAPAPETMADPRFTIRDKAGIRLVCYCPINNVGAVYDYRGHVWALYVPLDLSSFLWTLGDRGIELPEGDDQQTWLDAVSLSEIPKPRGPVN